MSKRVTFYLGPAVGLSNRVLTVTRMHRAGDDTAPTPEINDYLAGSAESSTQTLTDNVIYQAKLVDALSSGEVSEPAILNFHTGSLQFPGPRNDRLAILSMEDMSSSSSLSSSSLSSSSSSSSSLSPSSQSTSSSSVSSQSTSSSSVSSQSTSSSASESSSSSSSSASSSSSST